MHVKFHMVINYISSYKTRGNIQKVLGFKLKTIIGRFVEYRTAKFAYTNIFQNNAI